MKQYITEVQGIPKTFRVLVYQASCADCSARTTKHWGVAWGCIYRKLWRNIQCRAGIIRVEGIIRGRVLYEEIQYSVGHFIIVISRNKFVTMCCQSCKYFHVLQQIIWSIWKKIWAKLSMWTGYQMDTVKNEELKKNSGLFVMSTLVNAWQIRTSFHFFLMVWMTLHSIFFRWLFRNFDTVFANVMQLATTYKNSYK